MSNKVRGYSDVKLGSENLSLCLGLGALAEIESEFNVESFEEALNFGENGRVSAARLLKFMKGLLRGNGIELTPARLKELNAWTPQQFMEMITELLQSSGFSVQQEAQSKATSRPLAARNAGRRG
jgi:hypothetical protein